MKVAFFTDLYEPAPGGVLTSILNYKHALEKLGHQVYIVAPKYPGYIDKESNVIRLPSVDSMVRNGSNDVFRQIILTPSLPKQLLNMQFDVIHSNTPAAAGILADRLARAQHLPHIHTFHLGSLAGWEFILKRMRLRILLISLFYTAYFRHVHKDSAGYKLFNIMNTEALVKEVWRQHVLFAKYVTRLIVPSKHLATKLHSDGVRRPTILLPNCIDRTIYNDPQLMQDPAVKITLKDSSFTIAAIGRVSPEKRQTQIIEAVRHLDPAKDWQLVIVGDGPDMAKCRKMVADYGLKDKVVFTGQISHKQVAYVLRKSQVFIIASQNFDNQPMVILEALAAGLPIIYCDPALTEGLTKDNSILVGGDPQSIGQAFYMLLQDGNKLQAMSKVSKALSAEFDDILLGKRLIKIYQEAMADKAL